MVRSFSEQTNKQTHKQTNMISNRSWPHCATICTLYVLVSWVRSFDTELSSKLIDSCLYVRLWTSHISSEFFCAWLFVSLRAVVLHTYLHLVKLLSGENFNEQVQTTVDKLWWKLSVKEQNSRDKYVQCINSCTLCVIHVL